MCVDLILYGNVRPQFKQVEQIIDVKASEPNIADAIGAGDNFDAVSCGDRCVVWSVEASLELGHRCAVSSLAQPGGIRGQLCEQLKGS